jgi:thymidylate synthase (FAD)
MRIVNQPEIEIIQAPDPRKALEIIEEVARTCYASHNCIQEGSAERLTSSLVESGHGAMLEFGGDLVVRLKTTRPVSHEAVRHRLPSFAERSQRYCNFSKEKFGSSIEFLAPCEIKPGTHEYDIWFGSCLDSENAYFKLLGFGVKPENARSSLNQSVVTQIVIGSNFREWLHIFDMRCSQKAWIEMRRCMLPLLAWCYEKYPVIFKKTYDRHINGLTEMLKSGYNAARITEGAKITEYAYENDSLTTVIDRGW